MHLDWWTLVLQAVNVLILVWILARFLYRPVSAVIEQRRAAAAKLLADVSVMKSAIETEKASVRAARDGISAERDKLLADARKEIAGERDTMLRDAAKRIETLNAQGIATLARERAAMEHALGAQASELAVEIARRLLERVPADAAMAAFLDALCAQIRTLPPGSRELLAASAKAGTLAMSAARPLNQEQEAKCRAAISSALGMKAEMSFQVDQSLIAGLQLSAGALVLKNHWQADLAQILQTLKSDDQR